MISVREGCIHEKGEWEWQVLGQFWRSATRVKVIMLDRTLRTTISLVSRHKVKFTVPTQIQVDGYIVSHSQRWVSYCREGNDEASRGLKVPVVWSKGRRCVMLAIRVRWINASRVQNTKLGPCFPTDSHVRTGFNMLDHQTDHCLAQGGNDTWCKTSELPGAELVLRRLEQIGDPCRAAKFVCEQYELAYGSYGQNVDSGMRRGKLVSVVMSVR